MYELKIFLEASPSFQSTQYTDESPKASAKSQTGLCPTKNGIAQRFGFFRIILIMVLCLTVFYGGTLNFIGISRNLCVEAVEDLPLGQRVLPAGMEQPRQRIRNVVGGFYSQNVTLFFRNSPFRVQSELIVESGATLTIETGVQLYFETGVGMKVFGAIQAIGNEFAHIQMLPYQEQLNYDSSFPEFRLIDGPNVRQGRLQVLFRDRWRSVCTRLTNWTSIDTGVACRSMGYSDGGFWRFYRRNNDTYPFAMPRPNCLPNINNLWDCEGFSDRNMIPLTENLCQGEDDIGLYCWGRPIFNGWAKHWKGLQIFSSPFGYVYNDPDMVSVQRESFSRLEFVDILYGGYDGYTKNTTAALYIEGVPPIMNGLRVQHSARDGVHFHEAQGPILMANSTISNNRGHGICIDNTVDARFFLNQSIVRDNFGDGVWYRQQHIGMTPTQQWYGYEIGGNADERKRKRRHNSYYEKEQPRIDFCAEHRIPTNLYFPHLVKAHLQNGTAIDPMQPLNQCWMMVSLPPRLRYSYTIQFINVENRNPANFGTKSDLLICDGNSTFPNVCQVEHYRIPLKDGVLPQSVTLPNSEKALFIGIEHQTGNQSGLGTVYGDIDLLLKVHASVTYKAFYGLNITNSVILNNTGNGIQAINVRDRTVLSNVTIEGNQGLAGFLVRDGAADIWLNDTSCSYNWGDGINISYAGGSINVNSSTSSFNRWRGFAFHHNDSIPFWALRHEIVIKGRPANNIFYPKMLISENLWGGLLIGNYCIPSSYGWQPRILINWVEFVNNAYHPAIEIFSCQSENMATARIDLSGNSVLYGSGMGMRMEPCVNAHLTINSNRFHNIQNSALLIRNAGHPQLWRLPAEVQIYKNDIKMNVGRQYIVSIGLNEDSPVQTMIFDQQNEIRSNTVINPFPLLKARSAPHAALVVSSSNVIIQHNCFGNPKAEYEIATEVMEHAKRIDARKNNWGDTHPHNFMHRIFDQFNRYSLAVVDVNPFAAVCNQRVPAITYLQQFYRQFRQPQNPFIIGGTIFENSDLPAGTYTVIDDLHVTPGAKLTLAAGTRLEFLNGIGMLVQGELLRSDYMNPLIPVIFTSKSFVLPKIENIRLVDDMGNEDVLAGRLEVRMEDGLWGTVCNRSWTAQMAQLTCNQLGLSMDPQYFENWRIFPEPGDLPIRMDNIRCEEREFDLTKCRHDGVLHNAASQLSCRPTEVVGIRCAEPHWAGVRYSLLANPPTVTGQITMHNWIIEKAGLFDFRTSTFSPALQIDWNYHVFNSLTIRDNFYNGLDVIYNDLTKKPAIRNSYFMRNRRNGLVIRSNGITIQNVIIEGNANAGVHYNARVDASLQRDIISWLDGREQPELEANNIRSFPSSPPPQTSHKTDGEFKGFNSHRINFAGLGVDTKKRDEVIQVFESQLNHRMFLVAKPSMDCSGATGEPCVYEFVLQAVGHQFGLTPKLAVQIVNRCHNESDEDAVFFDPHASNGILNGRKRAEWSARQHTIEFPIVSSGSTLHMRYTRSYGRPSLVLLILFLDAQEYLDRFVHVYESVIRRNQYAISAVHYSNLTFNDNGAVLTRYVDEKLWFQKVNFSQNIEAVLWIHSPQHEVLDGTPIAKIGWHIDNCSLISNYGPIVDMHRDLYSSANVFSWNFWSNTFANNTGSAIHIQLPDTYDLLARQEHKFLMTENRFENNKDFGVFISGYYAFANISSNNFTDNWSRNPFGILELSGMEKRLIMERNRFFNNWGAWMIRVETLSQSLRGIKGAEILAEIQYNYFQFNHFIGKIDDYVDMWPRSYAVGIFGTQKVDVHFNRFRNVLMDFELVAGCSPQIPGIEFMNVTHNWWGVANEAEVSQRIFDLDDWNIYTVALFSPFYTAEELFINFWWETNKAQLFYANYTEPSAHDLKGRMYESKTLALDAERWHPFPYYYRPFRPYRITKDLTIMPGATLTIERNVEIHIWPNVRILVLGNLIADATLWQPIRFKPINATEYAEQQGRVGTRFRRFVAHSDNNVGKRNKSTASQSGGLDDENPFLFDMDYEENSEFWNRRREQNRRNSDTLWWKRYRRRNKRHNIDTRFVEYRLSPREKRRSLKNDIHENIDVFRQFPEMRRDNPSFQEFSVMLTQHGKFPGRSGFLSFYNRTTGEIVPSCDRLFTLRNAQVVCRELGFAVQNVYHWLTPRWDYFPLLRILKTYVESRECRGTESRLDKCQLRLSGAPSNWQCIDSENFNYIHCGETKSLSDEYIGNWGGITFASSSLDFGSSTIRNQGESTSTFAQDKSILRHVEIVGGGLSHNDSLQAAALQIIRRSPIIENVNVTNSSMHAIQVVSPTDNIVLSRLNVSDNPGKGMTVASANLHPSANTNAAMQQGPLNLPYSLPGVLNMCASGKTIEVESRVLVFYKYDSVAVDCVKIFRVAKRLTTPTGRQVDSNGRTLGFRFLQVNLYDRMAGIGRSDALSIYNGADFLPTQLLRRFNGDSFRAQSTAQGMNVVLPDSKMPEKSQVMGIHLRATAADGHYGFFAEVSILPSAPISKYVEEVALRNSRLLHNDRGALSYRNVGEIGPAVIVEQCLVERNGYFLYGNISTSAQAMEFNLHNTILFLFRANAFIHNRGGILVLARSSSSVAQLNAVIKNNAFVYNSNSTSVAFVGNNYQKITLLNNLIGKNVAPYYDTVLIHGVSTNFTENLIFDNVGLHTIDMQSSSDINSLGLFASNFAPTTAAAGISTTQTLRHNFLVGNLALGHSFQYPQHFGYLPPDSKDPHDHYDEFRRRPKRQVLNQNGITFDWWTHVGSDTGRYRSTILVGPSSHQKFEANIFDNPLNDYELTTSQQTQFSGGTVDARENYWGFPSTPGVASGKIRDQADYPLLTRVDYLPVLESNTSIVEGDCEAGYFQVGKEEFKSCFRFIGASMTYADAVKMCEEMNAFMPILRTDDQRRREIAARVDSLGQRYIVDIERYNSFGLSFDIPIWISSVTLPSHQCGWMSSRTASIGEQNCNNLLPFVCEKGTKPYQEPIMWRKDIILVALSFIFLIILILMFAFLALCKAQQRKEDFAKRKAFVRDSLRRKSQTFEKLKQSTTHFGEPGTTNVTNMADGPPPEMVETGAFNRKWRDDKLTCSGTSCTGETTTSYMGVGSESVYETFDALRSESNVSLRSDFCKTTTRSCCSSGPSSESTAVVSNSSQKSERKCDEKLNRGRATGDDLLKCSFPSPSRNVVSMNPNGVSHRNVGSKLLMNGRRQHCYISSEGGPRCDSDMSSSLNGSIYESACGADESVTTEDSMASSRTYSTCCSGATSSSATSTTATLTAESFDYSNCNNSIPVTEDSNLCSPLQNNGIIIPRLPLLSHRQRFSSEKQRQKASIPSLPTIPGSGRTDISRTATIANGWTNRSNIISPLRASSRPDLSHRSTATLAADNVSLHLFDGGINTVNLFTTHSNPSLYHHSTAPNADIIPIQQQRPFDTINKNDVMPLITRMQDSPRSSFRRRQVSGGACNRSVEEPIQTEETVYMNLRSFQRKGDSPKATGKQSYQVYKHPGADTIRAQPYERSTRREGYQPQRPTSAASALSPVDKAYGECFDGEVTPLETSM